MQNNYLFVDCQSVNHLGKNPTFHSRFKHIDVRYHCICNVLDVMLLELDKVHIDNNGIDMMTKALSRQKLKACCEIVGLVVHGCEGEMCLVGLPTMYLKSPNISNLFCVT